MRATSKVVALMVASGLAAIPPFVGLGSTRAQDEAPPARSARGGTLGRTAHYQFEAFFYASGLRVFVSDAAGAAVGASALSGTATFYHPDSPRPWFARPLRPASVPPGLPAESLDLVMDLSTVPRSGATVTFEVRGLPDPTDPTATFTVPFTGIVSEPGSSRAAQSASPARSDKIPPQQAHYYPFAGFYRLKSGSLVWIPSPGYYYGVPAQYHSHLPSNGASDRVSAQPVPAVGRSTAARGTGAAKPNQTELYWRPRAFVGALVGGTAPNRTGPGSQGR